MLHILMIWELIRVLEKNYLSKNHVNILYPELKDIKFELVRYKITPAYKPTTTIRT